MLNSSCYSFVKDLASSSPTPGGGSAAALTAALAAALGSMAAELSCGKKSVAEHWDNLESAKKSAKEFSALAAAYANKDAEGFLPLSKAYGIKAVTDEEKEAKAKILEDGLVTAAKAPVELLALCVDIAELIKEISRMSTKLAVSDAGCAASLCEAAAKCAYLNILANTRLMKDRIVADAMNSAAEKTLAGCIEICEMAFAAVREVL